jgi:hypothetical protein
MAFVKFLLIVFAVVCVLRLVGRWLIGSWIRSVQKAYGQPRSQAQERPRGRAMREGEVKVSGTATAGRKVNDRIGDYVDYEEIP